ncbi:3-oxoacyl-[acyl-carrier-protein] synthase III C-terminal domain-containing protein [Luteipulveratus sp. YIM 133132]|uniref:3-oxoacyl-[acyl-carrier-protein] synthase III C-terminal domain-containing protein n=1 Tax=Luteipulveratus flavus TaxID=3031728 RepID=A0ABT6C6M0_9MICO|nr:MULTISPECIES: 3-oxoacyl-[acyl-carrier-protein] synthase III C-terminal domain-containing protein [unclassified Luteipulveratus]MDE9365075.1 3-oxoacyl-[acyl-carrier-protein] synthase III C-terminal domain-containing protein [Luteipulveratus sp. YIM 133132]MDF8264589.1 3-oxoacyl-[acyl-carrier-protein] synthase III C-terminal domain-containing protein [Luteipulveratus sp. YIM 133296]
MTAILELASYAPVATPIAQHQERLGVSDADLRRMTRAFGYDRVAADREVTEAELVYGAASKLTTLKGREEDVRYVLRPRTTRSASAYPASPLQDVVTELGLHRARTFALNEQACASGLLALDLAGALLAREEDPEATALIIVGEKTYGAVASVIPGMAVLGEGTAAVLVGAHGERDRLVGYSATTQPVGGGRLAMDEAGTKEFGAVYSERLTAVIAAALEVAGLTAQDLAMYLPHNVGRILCQRTGSALGLKRDQIFTDNIGRYGHCWGADPFLNLASVTELGLLNPGDHYLTTSVGLGATFAAAVLQH